MARIKWKTLLTEEERAIILKLEGSVVEADLWLSVMLERDQQGGAVPENRIFV